MRSGQTVKFGRVRLVRFETSRIYSYTVSGNRVTKRAGVYRIGK